MAVRPEQRFFFIYDCCLLQDQDDDITKSVLYFDPKSTPVREQCTLVGHVVGVLDCVASLAGSPVATFRLHDRNIAVKHVDHYILGLSGEVSTPVSVLHELLDALYDTFRFFHSGIHSFQQACIREGRDFAAEFEAAWDCYFPFVRRYGDALSVGFQCVPFLPESKLKDIKMDSFCSQLMHDVSHLVSGVVAGCILYQNQVVFTQLSVQLTSRLCIVQPKQNHLSCEAVNTDERLPEGVRVLSVYVSAEEYNDLTLCHRSSDQQANSVNNVIPTQPRLAAVYNRDDDQPTVDAVDDTVGVEMLDRITDEVFARHDAEQHQSQHPETHHATAVYRSSATPDRSCADETSQLVPLELYIQGNSYSVFLLFMRHGSSSERGIIKDLWCRVLPQLAEMECLLLQTSDNGCKTGNIQDGASETLPAKLNYLVFNCEKQTLSGTVMSPCRVDEHSFCQRALNLHDDLRCSPDLVSKTFSSNKHLFGAVQHGHSQLFYELPHSDTAALDTATVNHLLSTS